MAPSVKRKRGGSSAESFKDVRQKIRTLEASLADKSNLNNLVEIFGYCKSDNAQISHAAIHSLNRAYTSLLMKGELKKPKNVDDTSAKGKVQAWLYQQYIEYVIYLRNLLSSDEPGLQLPALNILMTLIKSESENMMNSTGTYHFANNVYGLIVKAIVVNDNFNEHLRKEVVEKYLNVYDDLRHYFFKDSAELITKILEKNEQAKIKSKLNNNGNKKAKLTKEHSQTDEETYDKALIASNLFSIMENIRTFPTDSSEIDEFWTVSPAKYEQKDKKSNTYDELLGEEGLLSEEEEEEEENDMPAPTVPNGAIQKKKKKRSTPPLLHLKVHKRGFSDCWINLFKLPFTEEMYKKVLLILHKRILPHMSEPKLLMDFLTDSYNVGGSVSLLALNGLFTLITEHNLDYPDFYKKLYSLLDRNVMHVKYRSRFFRLLELFLSSAYLPANLIAAFIKRMARLSLTAPPAASVIVIPFIYNLLKRHPTCMAMIHSDRTAVEEADPFSMEELDPYKSKAISSSLWEVQTLAQHHYANVATLAKIFGEQFLKPKYNLEDFLDHTYATFFTTEIDRKRKKEPALAIDKPVAASWEI